MAPQGERRPDGPMDHSANAPVGSDAPSLSCGIPIRCHYFAHAKDLPSHGTGKDSSSLRSSEWRRRRRSAGIGRSDEGVAPYGYVRQGGKGRTLALRMCTPRRRGQPPLPYGNVGAMDGRPCPANRRVPSIRDREHRGLEIIVAHVSKGQRGKRFHRDFPCRRVEGHKPQLPAELLAALIIH